MVWIWKLFLLFYVPYFQFDGFKALLRARGYGDGEIFSLGHFNNLMLEHCYVVQPENMERYLVLGPFLFSI